MGSPRVTGRVSKAESEAIIIPFDEVLADLAKLQDETPDGFTTREMSAETGLSLKLCRAKIGELIDAGKAEYAGDRTIKNIRKQKARVPVYRLVNNENN